MVGARCELRFCYVADGAGEVHVSRVTRWVLAVAADLGAAFACAVLSWRYGLPLVPTDPGSGSRVALAVGVATVVGGVIMFALAYWASRAQPDPANVDCLFRERFNLAAKQIGNHSAPAEQLAGIAAMASLATDWPAGRQDCVDFLCRYMGLPYDAGSAPRGERQVRMSVIDVIRSHLDGSLEVGWQGCHFDFSSVVFDGGSLDGARFADGLVSFSGCTFVNDGLSIRRGLFSNCRLDCSRLRFEQGGGLVFDGARFDKTETCFADTEMASGLLSLRATSWYSGFHNFDGIRLQGGQILFDSALFVPSRRPLADRRHPALFSFVSCELSAGELSFREVRFDYEVEASPRRRERPLPSHEIAPPWPWTVTFEKTRFTGATVDFSGAQFVRGYVNLSNAFAASGSMLFRRARFGEGCLAFTCSKFREFVLDFSYATFTRNDDFSPYGPLRQRWLGPIAEIVDPKGQDHESPAEGRHSNREERQLKDIEFWELNYPIPSIDFTDALLENTRLEFEYINWASDGNGIIDFKRSCFDGADICFAHAALGWIVIVLWNAIYLRRTGRLRFNEYANPVILTDHRNMINNRLVVVQTDRYQEGHDGTAQEIRNLQEITQWAFGIK